MRAVQVPYAGGPFELVERPLPEPGPGEVRIKVEACGVCHSDVSAKQGGYPGQSYPLIPGHEVAGVIEALSEGVADWKVGQRVGVGWFGGQCGHCDSCRRGAFMACRNPQIPGITRDGGYAEAMVVSARALALIPEDLAAVEAAPMLCAGITTYNALKRAGLSPGDVVAVLGIGGLGHLAVQFAAKMGFHVVAVGRGREKEALARQLGAHGYVDSEAENVAAALNALGGARAVISTVTGAAPLNASVDGLTFDGKLMVLGAPHDPIVVPAYLLLRGRSIQGSAGGTAIEAEDAMAFSRLVGVAPMIETLPLERAAEAYDRMMSGEARFRMVLTTGL
jgi:D-arabinose 1-dehydrogenase-like Zn-dependent alcohol dehydrogenase